VQYAYATVTTVPVTVTTVPVIVTTVPVIATTVPVIVTMHVPVTVTTPVMFA
jgi:hypothetical protein